MYVITSQTLPKIFQDFQSSRRYDNGWRSTLVVINLFFYILGPFNHKKSYQLLLTLHAQCEQVS